MEQQLALLLLREAEQREARRGRAGILRGRWGVLGTEAAECRVLRVGEAGLRVGLAAAVAAETRGRVHDLPRPLAVKEKKETNEEAQIDGQRAQHVEGTQEHALLRRECEVRQARGGVGVGVAAGGADHAGVHGGGGVLRAAQQPALVRPARVQALPAPYP